MIKFFIMVTSLILLGCGQQEEIDRLTKLNDELKQKLFDKQKTMHQQQIASDRIQFLVNKMQGYKAIITTKFGKMRVKFFPERAPLHVYTFITRAESGFYDGTKFHRIMKGFMIQGGSALSKNDNINANDGMGGVLVNMPYEITEISHKRGMLSTANVGDPNRGEGSQFFIMHGNSPQLDGKYTVFGELVDGFDVLDKIANVQVHPKNDPGKDVTLNMPLSPVVIQSVEIVR